MKTFDYIIIHHTAYDYNKDIEEVADIVSKHHKRLHKQPNWLWYHTAYHYIINKDWEYKNTRPVNEIWYHCWNWNYNKNSIAISLVWNFENETPTKEQYKTLWKIIKEIEKQHWKKEILWHYNVRATACPWKNFSFSNLKNILNFKNDNMVDKKNQQRARNLITTLQISVNDIDWISQDMRNKIVELASITRKEFDLEDFK